MTDPQSIDADIRRATTLPGEVYRDRTTYERWLRRAFVPSWQWVGHRDELDNGHARPVDFLRGSLDEPLMLRRDHAGELRCFSNVCTHRAGLLVKSSGPCKQLRCGYHGRQFDADGRLKHMPAFETTEDFPREADHLPRLPLHEVCGGLFTALAPNMDFESWVQPMQPLLDRLPQAEFMHEPARSETYEVKAHWALYLDNFLEGFHIPYVHPALNKALVDEDYRTQLFPHASVQIGRAREDSPAFEPAQTLPGFDGRIAAYYYWLFPSTMFNFYPWGLSINVVEPLGMARTRVHFHSYVWRPELCDQGAGSGLDEVQQEDEDVVEQVQRGVHSRLYTSGRFSPTKEQGVHHFHRMLAKL